MPHRTTLSTALALGIAAVALATPQTAQAGKDMKMRFGIGGQRTLTGYSQIRARFFPITNLHVGLGFGVVVWDPHVDDVDHDAYVLATLSPEVMGWYVSPAEGPVSANFGGGLRFGLAFGADGQDDDTQNGLDNPFEIDIELPLSAEVFFGNHFSFAPEAGIVFRIVPGEAGDPDDEWDENPGSGCDNTMSPIICQGTNARAFGRGPGFGFDIGANAGLFAGGSFNFFF
jgi:hypothetical protein